MGEEKDNKAEEKDKPAEDTGEGIQSKAISELDRADQIAERQKRENDRREELLIREEALEARRKIGGIADAGEPQEKKPEMSNAEYSDKVLKGEFNK